MGWLFLWDHIGADWPFPVGDPWIALAAMAMTTERIKLGPLVTPLPRRRPWKLARETVTLDRLSCPLSDPGSREWIRQGTRI
jgi:alkanesulfonate monooxygenase SsuD/methylene tetrahydromethanopterin reductase-like flavin-dependent oxidoreductase (luciferase family)